LSPCLLELPPLSPCPRSVATAIYVPLEISQSYARELLVIKNRLRNPRSCPVTVMPQGNRMVPYCNQLEDCPSLNSTAVDQRMKIRDFLHLRSVPQTRSVPGSACSASSGMLPAIVEHKPPHRSLHSQHRMPGCPPRTLALISCGAGWCSACRIPRVGAKSCQSSLNRPKNRQNSDHLA
jgi:hypothetical protein